MWSWELKDSGTIFCPLKSNPRLTWLDWVKFPTSKDWNRQPIRLLDKQAGWIKDTI